MHPMNSYEITSRPRPRDAYAWPGPPTAVKQVPGALDVAGVLNQRHLAVKLVVAHVDH